MEKTWMTLWGEKKAVRDARKVIMDWWNGLSKGEMAELRRSHSIPEVAITQPYARLYHALSNRWRVNEDFLAMVAGLLAQIRKDNGDSAPSEPPEQDKRGEVEIPTKKTLSLASMLAGSGEIGGRPPYSELRFRRLLQRQEPEAVFLDLLRVVRLLKRHVNPMLIAETAYHWGFHEYRRRFALAYYENLLAN